MAALIVDSDQASSRLSELIREAERGTEVILARNGQMVAKLIPWRAARQARTPGAWAGLVTYGDDDRVGSDRELLAAVEESMAEPGQGPA